MEEIWKDIEGYEGLYQVSNLGKVKSLDRTIITRKGYIQFFKGKMLDYSKRKNNCGYYRVSLSGKEYLVHQLVAKTFILNPYEKSDVNHLDGNKSNNNVENLEWCTHIENMQHAFNSGLAKTINQNIL